MTVLNLLMNVKPSHDTVKPSQNIVKPSQNSVKPSQNSVKPSHDTVKPIQNNNKTNQDTIPFNRYLSVMPPIHLAIPISPSIARELRHPAEFEVGLRAAWQFIPGVDHVDQEVEDGPVSDVPYPSTPSEVAFTLALSIPSILFIVYILIVLYRCMCSRNYAEWRSSWSKRPNKSEDKVYSEVDPDSYLIMETLPLKLKGHLEVRIK
ncbi:sterol regulatory element-binding protein cleavage-activating protein-like, partial [Limulus polyphemus]|uniref:Sterol regulatory element-binding protein cleavage-activating protein-like n=1 Tax=Limulus polyphemus TaxID=6850 RepID=A0ABM1RZY5_LIMPO